MEFCNGSQLIDFCYYAGEKHPRTFLKKELVSKFDDKNLILPSEAKKVYMRVMTIFNAVLVVFAPIVLVIVLNMLMIRELRFNDLSLLEGFHGIISRNQHYRSSPVTSEIMQSLPKAQSAFQTALRHFLDIIYLPDIVFYS
uniref:Anoctamin n=1 Tax=Heterorhabditis bacteriophora TaxID=37862 RepID=A0A1I7WUI6_HETBA